jgi:predicted phage terminase large subunit-like protein
MNDEVYKFLDTPEKITKTRIALQNSFWFYIKFIFYALNNTTFTFKPFHYTVIQKLQAIADQKNTKRNLCLNLPVGSGKSIIVELFITWCFARSINHTFCYVSHSDMLIRKLSKEAKDIIESEIWQLLFENKLKKDDKASNKYSFENSNNRTGLTAGTMGGAITGLDAGNPNIKGFSGALIIDDPIDVGNARHALAKEECIRFYTDKLSTRRRDPKVPTILIMQRVDKEDLPGWIAEKEPEEWDIVKIPALNEKNESFWAERYPVSELLKEKNINPFKFYSQYQQEPITAGGQVIKTKWWQYYFDKEIENISFNRIFITVDTAQKTKEHNDYSVFTCWGLADNLYLLDGIRGKWEAPDLRKEALRFWQKWQNGLKGRPCQAFYVEDKSSGTGLIQDLMRVSYIPIIGVQRDTDKLTRLEDVLYYIASGRVYLPKELTFTDELISEAEAFARNMSHKHDDIIDCVIDAVNKAFNVGELSILDVID